MSPSNPYEKFVTAQPKSPALPTGGIAFEHPQPQNPAIPGAPSTMGGESTQELQRLSARIDSLALTLQNLVQTQTGSLAGTKAPLLSTIMNDARRPVDKNRGVFTVVSTAPSAAPTDPFDQIRVYVNSTTYRLYWYDWNASVWHYVTATA